MPSGRFPGENSACLPLPCARSEPAPLFYFLYTLSYLCLLPSYMPALLFRRSPLCTFRIFHFLRKKHPESFLLRSAPPKPWFLPLPAGKLFIFKGNLYFILSSLFCSVISVNFIVNNRVNMREKTSRSAISNTWDKMSSRSIFLTGSSYFPAYLLLCGICSVHNGCVDSSISVILLQAVLSFGISF